MKRPRAAGIQPEMERARRHLLENFDLYIRASDFLRPTGKRVLRHLRNHQLPPALFAWLYKYRGWPREYIPYPVDLDEYWPRVVWMAMGEWADLKRMAEALSFQSTGRLVDREEIIRWLYGKEPPDWAKPWLEEQAARRVE